MRQTVLILISPDDPVQKRLASELNYCLIKDDVNLFVPRIISQYFDQQSDLNDEIFTLAGQQLVIDLGAMSSTSAHFRDPHYQYFILGGFSQGHVQPFSEASGIQEVAEGCPHTDLAIASQTGAGDWTIWLHASIPTMRIWRKNQQQLITAAAEYAAFWLRKCCIAKRYLKLGRPTECLGLSYTKTSAYQQLGIRIRHTTDRIRTKLRRIFRRKQSWQVGWMEANRYPNEQVHLIPSQGSVWFADPYVWRDQQKRLWILCEHFDDAGDQRGRIALFEINKYNQAVPRGIVLEEPFHLSFPRLLEFQNRLYLTVESYQSRDVRLYTAGAMTEEWKLCRILLQGDAFIDPILVHHDDGVWYLFVNTTSVQSIKREVAPELRLFYSNDLLEGDFCEHPASPLVISSRGGRNAGLIRQDKLVRVGQQTGYGGVYGESTALFQVDELSRTSYRESPLRDLPSGLQPEGFRKQLKASHLHTLNTHDQVLVFDFIRA